MVFQCVSVCCHVGAIWGIMGQWVDGICLVVFPPKEVGSGATVPGFPNGGVATTLADGRGFSWGDQPIVAAGKTYDLCWCNGTASGCLLLGWACGLDGHDELNQF